MTTWRKNEPTASKRDCAIQVFKDNAPCPRGTDLMATGFVYFRGANSPDADPAIGTMTNVRRGLVVADDVIEAVDTAADTLQLTAHGLETGDGPIQFTAGGVNVLPTPLATATDYWVIKVDADNIAVATTLADAYAGTKVDLTAAGSGTRTLVDTASTQRGFDGRFVYRAAQAELNHDGDESEVFVDSGASGTPYALIDGNGGSAYVTMDANGALLDTVVTDDGKTLGDLLRFLYWTDGAGEIDKDPVTGAISIWNKTHTKVIATMTVTADGRHVIAVNDLGL